MIYGTIEATSKAPRADDAAGGVAIYMEVDYMDSVSQNLKALTESRQRLQDEIKTLQSQLAVVNQTIRNHEFQLWLDAEAMPLLKVGQRLDAGTIQRYLIRDRIGLWGWQAIDTFCSGEITITHIHIPDDGDYAHMTVDIVSRAAAAANIPYRVAVEAWRMGGGA